MRTSLEKLDDFFAASNEPPSPDAGVLELGIKQAFLTLGPMIRQMIPQDPEDVDRLMETIAVTVLSMRSDTPDTEGLWRPLAIHRHDAEGTHAAEPAELAAGADEDYIEPPAPPLHDH